MKTIDTKQEPNLSSNSEEFSKKNSMPNESSTYCRIILAEMSGFFVLSM